MWIDNNTKKKYPLPKKINDKEIKIGWSSVKGAIGTDKKITKHSTEEYICSYKIRVYFTPEQLKIVTNWLNISRWITNMIIRDLKRNTLLDGFYDERAQFKLFKKANPNHPMVKLINDSNFPGHMEDTAIKRVFTSKKSANTNQNNNRKTKSTKQWKMRYIKKTKPKQIMVIDWQCFSISKNSFSKNLGPIKSDNDFCLKDDNGKNIRKESILQYHKNTGHWYMFCPRIKTKKVPPIHKTTRKCALDPGSRKFLTLYDGNRVSTIGDNVKHRLDKVIKQTEISPDVFKSHDTYLKFIRKRHNKIDRLVKDLHWKSAKYIAVNYDTVIIGILSTSSCIRKTQRNGEPRKISSTNAKLLQTLSHFTFRQRLKYMCNKYNCEYREQNEYYTSQICGGCGAKHSMDCSETYKCPDCEWTWDRDFNGARNIMIKNDKGLVYC